AFACWGAASVANRFAWPRALAMTIGSSVYSFTLILVTFLLGIAGGSAIASSLFARGTRPVVSLAVAAAALTFVANGSRFASPASLVGVSLLFCVPIVVLPIGLVLRTRPLPHSDGLRASPPPLPRPP